MPVDPVGLEGMKGKLRTLLGEIDIDNVSRKYHDKKLYEIASTFRSLRSITHKKVLVE